MYLLRLLLVVACTTPLDAVAEDLCLLGCPRGAPRSNVEIARHVYVLSNNATTKFADWVAYRVTRSTIGSGGDRNYKADPDLREPDTLEEADYLGAPAALHIDHGHQAPLASFTGTRYWPETNFLSNITPQKAELNQGPWERLEAAERKLAKSAGVDAVFVVTGPLYEKQMQPLPRANEPHQVPSGYWKVVAVQTSSEVMTAAFIMDQDLKRRANYCNYAVPIAQVESRTNLVVFPQVDARLRNVLESGPGELLYRLGCTIVSDERGVRILEAR